VELKDILVLEARIKEEAENFQILNKSTLLKTLPEIDRHLQNDLHVFFEQMKELAVENYLGDEAQEGSNKEQ